MILRKSIINNGYTVLIYPSCCVSSYLNFNPLIVFVFSFSILLSFVGHYLPYFVDSRVSWSTSQPSARRIPYQHSLWQSVFFHSQQIIGYIPHMQNSLFQFFLISVFISFSDFEIWCNLIKCPSCQEFVCKL